MTATGIIWIFISLVIGYFVEPKLTLLLYGKRRREEIKEENRLEKEEIGRKAEARKQCRRDRKELRFNRREERRRVARGFGITSSRANEKF